MLLLRLCNGTCRVSHILRVLQHELVADSEVDEEVMMDICQTILAFPYSISSTQLGSLLFPLLCLLLGCWASARRSS